MDPCSRHIVWNLLRNRKANRVTVFSTHFMDEADILAGESCCRPSFVPQPWDTICAESRVGFERKLSIFCFRGAFLTFLSRSKSCDFPRDAEMPRVFSLSQEQVGHRLPPEVILCPILYLVGAILYLFFYCFLLEPTRKHPPKRSFYPPAWHTRMFGAVSGASQALTPSSWWFF